MMEKEQKSKTALNTLYDILYALTIANCLRYKNIPLDEDSILKGDLTMSVRKFNLMQFAMLMETREELDETQQRWLEETYAELKTLD